MRHIIFDTETTGLDPRSGDRLVEIGAVEMIHGGLTGRTFHVYINPQRDMPAEAYRVHKLSSEFLSDKPVFRDPSIAQAFLDFCGDAVLIAHNAPFDCGFVKHHLEEIGLPWRWTERDHVIDTVKIARRRFPGSPASLDALCQRFGIDLSQREAQGHGALLDARLLAEVYIELTGGAQGGFSFKETDYSSGGGMSLPRLVRGKPRPCLLTPEEEAAHDAFVSQLTEPLWRAVREAEAPREAARAEERFKAPDAFRRGGQRPYPAPEPVS